MNLYHDTVKYFLKLGLVFTMTIIIAIIVSWLFSHYVWQEDFYLKDAILKSFIPALILTIIWIAQNKRDTNKRVR